MVTALNRTWFLSHSYPPWRGDGSAFNRKMMAISLVTPLILMISSRATSIWVKTRTSFIFIPTAAIVIFWPAKGASPLHPSSHPWIRTLHRRIYFIIFIQLKIGFFVIFFTSLLSWFKGCVTETEFWYLGWKLKKTRKNKQPCFGPTHRPFWYKAIIIDLSYTSVSPVCHCKRQKVSDTVHKINNQK